MFFGLSGSDANETNIKLVWYYNNVLNRPEKKKIISRWRGYHGSGLMTGSLTGLELFHKHFDLPLARVLHTDAPYFYHRSDLSMDQEEFSSHCARRLEELVLAEGPDTVAAFIGEPMLGTGGLVPLPAGYWKSIQEVLRRYDILLIADEVVTGFGRLGSMFGSGHYGMRPDLITIAKGLTSAYTPLSGVIVSERMWRTLEEGSDALGVLGHGWTYSAHPLCAAAGVANLELIDTLGLVENAASVGAYLNERLRAELSGCSIVGEVRGEGLAAAVEFVANREDRIFFDPCLKVGLRVATALLERGDCPGNASGRHPRLCPTALHHAGRSRYRRRSGEGGGGGGSGRSCLTSSRSQASSSVRRIQSRRFLSNTRRPL